MAVLTVNVDTGGCNRRVVTAHERLIAAIRRSVKDITYSRAVGNVSASKWQSGLILLHPGLHFHIQQAQRKMADTSDFKWI